MRFQADDVAEPDRRDYWLHVVDQTIGPLDLRSEGLGSGDVLTVDDAGPIRVGELWTSGAGDARRTAAQVRELSTDVCKIDVLLRGTATVEQNGHRADLRPGDFTLVDLSSPARWVSSAMCMVAVVFPRAVLPLSSAMITRLAGVPIAGRSPLPDLVTSTVRQLVDCVSEVNAAGRARLGTAVLDLLAVTLSVRLGLDARALPQTTTETALVRSAQAFMAANLGNPDLSPRVVADAHHISLRYLYRLFEDQGTTPAAWIRQLRLDRCRRDLLDPASHHRPIGAIGARWGLVNAAHFSRVFRKEYGVTPTEYRFARAMVAEDGR